MIDNTALHRHHGFIRRYLLPKTIYGRLCTIIVLPVLMVQVFSLFVFFHRHWTQATQSLSSNVVRTMEIAIRTHKIDPKYATALASRLGLKMHYTMTPIAPIPPYEDRTGKVFYRIFSNSTIPYNMAIRFIPPNQVKVQVGNAHETYTFYFNEYQLYTTVTAKLVLLWTVFIGLICVIFSLIFARNQARPIKKLSQSVIAFSQGDKDAISHLQVRGSNEVREAIYNLKTMATRINRHQQQRSDMLSGISHDLRTPITRMKLQLALMDTSSETESLNNNLSDMEKMITSYLDFVSNQSTHWHPLNVHQILTELHHKWHVIGNPISLDLGTQTESPPHVQGDHIQIGRMLDNIISNGFRYGTQVHISLRTRNNKVALIQITDNGSGIPEERLEHVLRPFVRLDESRNTNTGGVGLGLSIALDIATKHGGNLHLENHIQNDTVSGLIATITLPLCHDTLENLKTKK